MTVYANGREISAEAQGCKVIADFPDTCFTPPENPATPPGVPVPYPDFGFDSDLTSGSGTVKIGNKPISQENTSYYSKCSGDEAGAAAKKGIITSKNTGKVYAHGWSSDVKVESKGVVRLGDMATSNHGTDPGDAPPMVIVGKPAFGIPGDEDCMVGSFEDIHEKCNAKKDPTDPLAKPGTQGVAHQAHHIVPDRCFRVNSEDRMANPPFPSRDQGICICIPRVNHSAARPPTGEDVTVHHHLDNALTELGEQVATRANPRGVEKVDKIRNQCLDALAELVDDPVSADCFEVACEKVTEQTEPIKDKYARAEKSSSNMSPAAKGVLNRQHLPTA